MVGRRARCAVCVGCTSGGSRRARSTTSAPVNGAQLATGITPIRRVYDLRHTFATFALRAPASQPSTSPYMARQREAMWSSTAKRRIVSHRVRRDRARAERPSNVRVSLESCVPSGSRESTSLCGAMKVTPSLPCAPKRLPWVATGCGSACLSGFRGSPICRRLPPVAPAGLHKCSIHSPGIADGQRASGIQLSARRVLSPSL